MIRQLQIDLITNDYNPIIYWFDNNIWSNIKIMEVDVLHKNGGELIYYIVIDNIKKWIFYRNDEFDKFLCNYDYYWSFLETRFYFNYKDIQNVTKMLIYNVMDNSNNADISTPYNTTTSFSWLVHKIINK